MSVKLFCDMYDFLKIFHVLVLNIELHENTATDDSFHNSWIHLHTENLLTIMHPLTIMHLKNSISV